LTRPPALRLVSLSRPDATVAQLPKRICRLRLLVCRHAQHSPFYAGAINLPNGRNRGPSTSSLRVALLVVFLLAFVGSSARSQTTNVPVRIAQAIDSTQTLVLRGNTHPLARAQYDRGVVADAQPLTRILLLLQRSPAQEAALQQFLDGQQSKASPDYHRWITPEQFGQQYGPADADVQTITDWLRSQGFTQVTVQRGRTAIEFSGNVAQVRNAFRTEIHHYMVNGEARMANSTDPQIPAALAPVVAGLVSLHNFPIKSHVQTLGAFRRSRATGEVKPLFTFSGCQSGNCYALGPPDFAVIYNTQPLFSLTPKIDGTGQTIAIIGESNINVQDVSDFRTIFGLPQNFTTQNVILNGPDPGINASETESDLDIQWAGGVAPGATIDFVTSASTETTSGVHLSALYAVDNNIAGILSESFGECEQGLGTTGNQFYNALWEQAAAQGITVILSSGDGGSAGCDNFDTQQTANLGLAVSGFASTPFNVAVGGTDFDQVGRESQFWNTAPTPTTPPVPASALKYIPEVPWNDTCAQLGLNGCRSTSNIPLNIVAGSGGASTIYTKPSWQVGYPGVPNDSHRDLPDVSLFASNGFNGSFYIICQRDITSVGSCNLNELSFTFQGLGGTSASAPAFAGIMALVDQKMGSRQGNANNVLYALAKGPGASCNSNSSTPPASTCTFNDITKGNNSVPCAGGTPNCSSMVAGINGVLVETISPTTPAFPAAAGYDLATGLGSVNVQNLVKNWNTVQTASTSTTLALNNGNPVSITHGSAVPVSISVTPTAATGIVALLGGPNGTSLGLDSFNLAGGNVSGFTSSLAGGTYTVTAHYAGDETYAPSDSNSVTVTVTPENSKTFANLVTLDLNGNPLNFAASSATYGSGFSLLRVDVGDSTATFSSATGISSNCFKNLNTCPSGRLALTASGAQLAESSLLLNSLGFAEDQSVVPGSYSIAVNYPGDSSFAASTATANFTIFKAPSVVTTAVAGSPVTYGNSMQIDADVATTSNRAAPTGTFIFSVDGAPVTGSVPVYESGSYRPNSSPPAYAWADAISTAAFPSVGNHTLAAQYSGDMNYAAAASAPVTVSVTQALPFFLGYGANPGSTNVNQSVTLVARLGGSDSGLPPTGTFTFYDGNTTLSGDVTYTPVPPTKLTISGLDASMPYTPTVAGTHQINVSYSGDANYLPATNPVPATLTVVGPDFVLTPQTSSAVVNAGSPATYTVAVPGTNGFTSTVSVTCATSAAATTCVANPPSVAAGGNIIITVTTTAHQLVLPIRFSPWSRGVPFFPITVLALLLFFFVDRCRRQQFALSIPLAAVTLVLMLAAAGCGGGSSPSSTTPLRGTQPGNYIVTITGTSGAISHTTTVSLTVN
jgi:hypothetical protein